MAQMVLLQLVTMRIQARNIGQGRGELRLGQQLFQLDTRLQRRMGMVDMTGLLFIMTKQLESTTRRITPLGVIILQLVNLALLNMSKFQATIMESLPDQDMSRK